MAKNGKREGIHVVGLDVESLHRIRVAHVELKAGGGLIRVTGKNKAGKTSLLKTLKEAFGGAGEVSAIPIHDGADAGQVRVVLSNGFTITRRITEQNPKGYLTVVAPDGGKHGQAKLNEWLGANSFDPLAFFTLKPERQREILLGLGNDPDLEDKLDAVRTEHARLYAERTPHNSEKQRCHRVKKPEGERPEPVDVSAEMQELRRLQEAQGKRRDAFIAAQSRERTVANLAEEVKEREHAVLEAERVLEEAKQRFYRANEQLGAAQAESEAAKKAYDAMADVAEEIEAVTSRISDAESVNRQLEPWKEYDRAQASLKEADKAAKALTDQINEKKAEELRLIAEAGIPVDGLTFDEETAEPLLNGFPLALASGGEKIGLAVSVALAIDPELRVCLVDEANDLDLEALEELDRLSKEHDFQTFACRIGIEAPGEIIVEDGEAKTPEPAEVAAS